MTITMVSQELQLISVTDTPDRRTTGQCIHTLIDERASFQPHKLAVETYDVSLSFAELCTASSRLSHYLVSLGVGRDERVAILMEACASYPLSALAVLKSGATFVPLDPTHPEKRLHQLVKEIDPVIIISSTSFQQKARSLHGNCLIVDQECATWRSLALTTHATVGVNDAAYIIFTSGSTGVPKGVVIEHGAFVTSALARGRLTGLSPGSRVLQYAAHTFDVSIDEIFTTLIHGGCVCIPSEIDRLLLEPAINRLKVNHALLTPTSAKMLEPDRVPGLKTLQLGGELLSDEVIKKWSNRVQLFNVYGPAEASVACIMIERTHKDEPGNVIGFPVGSICRIVDPDDHDRLLPQGAVGELVIGGRLLAREYWNDPVRTASSFIYAPPWASILPGQGRPRFYKSGDLAEMDENGMTRIHGRKDNQIKVRGQRINVEEIEALLLSTNLVWSVVVELPKKGPLINRLTAIVCNTSNPSSSTHPSSFPYPLRSFQASGLDEQLQARLGHELRNSLPPAMVPARWIHIPYLPHTSSGKIDRKWVRKSVEEMDITTFQSIFESTNGSNAGSGELYHIQPGYKQILCQVLGLNSTHIKPHLSFIGNGGDSIAAMELCRLGKEAGMSFWVGDILSTRSLQELFRISQSRLPKALVPEDQPGTLFPLSPVQRFFFDVIGDGPDSFTQSVNLQLKTRIELAQLKLAVNDLVSMHPMLRARFECQSGTWLQSVSKEVESSYSLSCRHVDGPFPSSNLMLPPTLSATSDAVFDVRLWDCSTGLQQLQLSAHHLVIDLMSWRIILHDLAKLLRREPLLGSTMSFQTWCSLQQKYTKTLNPQRILPTPIVPDNCAYWDPPGITLENKHGLTAKSSFSLKKSVLNSLTNLMSEVQPVEAMIGSFYKAFAAVYSDRETPTIFVESHGREPWDPEIDISQTVGWFTTAYPINVPAHQALDLQTSILHTMQTRRSIPANGHPYWCHRFLGWHGPDQRKKSLPMEFVLNFAGQFQQVGREDLPFRVLSTVGKENAHPDAQRLSIFDIFISIEKGRLDFTITFPSKVAHRDRIDDLLVTWKSVLESADLNGKPLTTAPTPFDCLKDVSSILAKGNFSLPNDIQNVYWVSDLQNHMLSSSARNSIFYRVVGTWRLRALTKDCTINISHLQDAWREVVANHSSLRTIFVYDHARKRFLAVVTNNPFPATSFGAASSSRSTAGIEGCLEGNREALLLPHRIISHGSNDDSIDFSLEFNHAIMDATSRSILLEELLDAFSGQPLSLDNSCYQRYIQDRVIHRSPRDIPEGIPCIFPPDLPDLNKESKIPLSLVRTPRTYTTGMGQICSQHGVTISSLIFTAWSLVLSKFVSKEVVSFAYVASGRSMDINGIERSVGLYVDLLILSVNVDAYSLLWNLALDIQQRTTGSISNKGSPIFASQNTQNGRVDGQVNTMVNIRNAGIDSLKLERNGLELSMDSFEDPWDYDLALAVDIRPGHEIHFSISHRVSAVSSSRVVEVANTLVKTLDLLLENPRLSRLDWKTHVNIARPSAVHAAGG